MEQRVVILEQSTARFERALEEQGLKLDRLIQIITRHEAAPQFDPFKILSFIVQATALFSLVVGGIVYVASNVNAGRIAVLEDRVNMVVSKTGRTGI
jgi:hypothetical protein